MARGRLPPGFRFTPSGLRGPSQADMPKLPPGYYYTPTGLRGGPNVQLEDMLRQFTSIFSFSTPRVPPEPVIEEPEAFIEWGGPSVFSFDDSFRDAANGITQRTDDDDDPENELTYSETGRSTSDLRVENPDSPDQFVIVQRIESISFNGPGGKRVRFQLSNPG